MIVVKQQWSNHNGWHRQSGDKGKAMTYKQHQMHNKKKQSNDGKQATIIVVGTFQH